MEKDGKKTFVSTFRLALKPQAEPCCAGRQKKNGVDTTNKTGMGNNKLGVSSATGARRTLVQSVEEPCFKEALRDCTVCEGSDATFQGVITGSRPLSISWLHNGERVDSRNTSFINDVASLTLTQCSPGNAGTYTCIAENTAGKQPSSAVLRVTATKKNPRTSNHEQHSEVPASKGERQHRQEKDNGIRDLNCQREVSASKGPPVEFLDPPEQVEVRKGGQALLHCDFRSSSVPVACCWIFNRDKAVVGRPRVSVRSTEMQSRVEISQAAPEDTGSYTVVVRNRAGSAQHTVSLSVIDRPDPPASHPVVSQLCTDSLVLSWTGPSYDGGTAVLGYVVEVNKEGPNKPGSWKELISRCKNTSYHVRSGLEPLGQYRFRVRAYNSAGVSEPSQESGSVKMATAKEKKEDAASYVTVTIDTKNKVKDHYDVHEKLGV